MYLKLFTSFMLLQVYLAVESPANCPVCTCPNSDASQNFEPPIALYSKLSNEDLASTQDPLPGIHIAPNEISDSAERFSRELLQVKKNLRNLRKATFHATSVLFACLFYRFWQTIRRLRRKISLCRHFQFGR